MSESKANATATKGAQREWAALRASNSPVYRNIEVAKRDFQALGATSIDVEVTVNHDFTSGPLVVIRGTFDLQ